MNDIVVKGAREHNLCEVDLRLPRGHLICFTGVSGSGKSSLAFDTLYAEGQRRYIESFSGYARQFLGQLPKPDVDHIAGLSPSISISQKVGVQNSRSTVGTVTEIYDYLRVLFARVATGYCPKCRQPVTAQTRERIFDQLCTLPAGSVLHLLAPVVSGQKGEHRDLLRDVKKQGFLRVRIDGTIVRLEEEIRLDRQLKHHIEVVVDRLELKAANYSRLAESIQQAVAIGKGQLIVLIDKREVDKGDVDNAENSDSSETNQPETLYFSTEYACPQCQISFEPPTPQMFSFNSPQGMCSECQGLGSYHTFDPELLIPDASLSFQQGAIVLFGKLKEMGRWNRHIFQGVSETVGRLCGFEKNYALETPWEKLDPQVKKTLLWGMGEQHVTFTWRGGPSGHKWGGKFEGIIPKLLRQYRETGSRIQQQGLEKYMDIISCSSCEGKRLNEQACAFKLETTSKNPIFSEKRLLSLPEVCDLSVIDLLEFFSGLTLSDSGQLIASEVVKEIRGRVGFLVNVGLAYLSLGRTAPTLSGGELQRIRLAGQIGSGLAGVLYVLDEPSIGLHPRDNQKLIDTLTHLKSLGNTIIVVEHDEDTMLASDYLVDFGPGPGVHGGRVVAHGPVEKVLKENESQSLTSRYLLGSEQIPWPQRRREIGEKKLIIEGAAHNNLKNIDIEIPLCGIICVTGVSGSGKSSLVNDILVEALNRDLNHGLGQPGKFKSMSGLKNLDKLIAIDQSPIGRTPRSNPATYIKLFDEIRKLFSELPDAKLKGFAPGRFSFNVPSGRCEACQGNGAQKLEMDFLADIWVTCPVCEGKRFNHDTLSVLFKGQSIHQVLEMDVESALVHFENIPKIKHKLQTLFDVGLGYMKLGQPSPTLSGGEAQRIKLARELVKKSTGKTLYLLDEPTTGLHFADIKLLLNILHNFADMGNTVLIVEHNLEVVKIADWIIDLGPEGGEAGGYLIAQGTPEQLMEMPQSYTGVALKDYYARQHESRPQFFKRLNAETKKKKQRIANSIFDANAPIVIRNASEHNLKGVSATIPRDRTTVCCGPSGSGKTSLAMDTIYAEGQRRYVESLSSYARQFLGQMQKPKVEQITGISPAIAIEQKSASQSPRSTVGTVTEIHDYLRVLFARLGVPFCPDCDIPVGTQSTDEIVARVLLTGDDDTIIIAAPLTIESGTDYDKLREKLVSQGFLRLRIDGKTVRLDEMPSLDKKRKYDLEVVIDRIVFRNPEEKKTLRGRISGSIETALDMGSGLVHLIHANDRVEESQWEKDVLSQFLSCPECGRGFERLTPHHFSFNSSLGWCKQCEGLGTKRGNNPTHILHDTKLSLRSGAVRIWSEQSHPYSASMLEVFGQATGIPLDLPFEQLDARFRRMIFQGTGERWFDVPHPHRRKETAFRFQYKGVYPAMAEAARLVPALRGRLEYQVEETECSDCLGSRLRDDVSAVRFIGYTMDQLGRMPLGSLLELLTDWQPNEMEQKVGGDLISELRNRLQFLIDVGLDYLTLSRGAASLSGGESQRIRLAAQIGSGLVGVLYILDEPTIGLHPRDNSKLIAALTKLKNLGNTLLVVEHDREMIANADHLLDFGPRAGKEGGLIVAQGTPAQIIDEPESVTGPYLSGTKSIPIPLNRRLLPVKIPTKPVKKRGIRD